jgi:manganese transport protein
MCHSLWPELLTRCGDLLVKGPHGHHLAGDLLWGETVDLVRHQAAITVLVVR